MREFEGEKEKVQVSGVNEREFLKKLRGSFVGCLGCLSLEGCENETGRA